MLHCILILNDDNYILLARYFQVTTSLDARKRFETQLGELCNQQQLLRSTTNRDRLLKCENQYVVFRHVGELRVLIAGSEEYDELILSDIMNLFNAVLVTQLDKKLTETSLLTNYAKVVAAMDEMVQHGHLETADEASIEQMSKLRPYPVK